MGSMSMRELLQVQLKDAVKNADVVLTCTGRDEDMMEIVFSDEGVVPAS